MDEFGDLTASLTAEGHVAIILADAGGHIRFWNDGAAALFGHAAADAVGRRVDLVVPESYREMHWAGFNRTIGSAWNGHDSFGAIEGLHSSGVLVPLEVLLTPMRGADGRVQGVLALFRRPAV